MTDKEKTIKELKEALDSLDITNKYRLNIIRAIEYLQEDPVSKDKLNTMLDEALSKETSETWNRRLDKDPVSEDLEEACEQLAENARKHKAETSSPFFSPTDYKQGVIDGAAWQKQKDSIVSEGLEEASKEWLIPQLDKSYANYGEAKMMELTHFDGYAMLDAIEFGAKWQKEKDDEEKVLTYKHCFEDCEEHIKEILLSEVLPYFMHGGEADEVVAMLDEILN